MNQEDHHQKMNEYKTEDWLKEKENSEEIDRDTTEEVFQNNEYKHSKFPSVTDWIINIDNL